MNTKTAFFIFAKVLFLVIGYSQNANLYIKRSNYTVSGAGICIGNSVIISCEKAQSFSSRGTHVKILKLDALLNVVDSFDIDDELNLDSTGFLQFLGENNEELIFSVGYKKDYQAII